MILHTPKGTSLHILDKKESNLLRLHPHPLHFFRDDEVIYCLDSNAQLLASAPATTDPFTTHHTLNDIVTLLCTTDSTPTPSTNTSQSSNAS